MQLKMGDGVLIAGWRAVVIALDEDARALVRWIRRDGSVEEHWYPLAALEKIEAQESDKWEGYKEFDASDGRSSVTGY